MPSTLAGLFITVLLHGGLLGAVWWNKVHADSQPPPGPGVVFDAKWVRGGAPADEPFLGSPDISALADMGGSYEVIEDMRSVPIAPEALIPLVVAILLPMLLLTLTMMPLEALLETLVSLMF